SLRDLSHSRWREVALASGLPRNICLPGRENHTGTFSTSWVGCGDAKPCRCTQVQFQHNHFCTRWSFPPSFYSDWALAAQKRCTREASRYGLAAIVFCYVCDISFCRR